MLNKSKKEGIMFSILRLLHLIICKFAGFDLDKNKLNSKYNNYNI